MLVLTFQIGSNRLALDIRRVREVVPRVELQRAPSGPPWLAGMFIYRGGVVPVIDLHRLFGESECPEHLSSRIILVPSPRSSRQGDNTSEPLLGLLAAQVADLREVEVGGDHRGLLGVGEDTTGLAFGTTLVDREGILHLVDLDRLLPEVTASTALLPRSTTVTSP